MKIAVLSDTHLTGPDEMLPPGVIEGLKGVDMILHAGDIVHRSLIDYLQTIAPTHAVLGNMDMPDPDRLLPFKRVVEAEGFRIGIIHGWGPPEGLKERVEREFTGVDCIVFGHSHFPEVDRRNGILFFNPGSPTDRRWAPYCSMGILSVSDTIEGRIVPL